MNTLARRKSAAPSKRARPGRVGVKQSRTAAIAAATGRDLAARAAVTESEDDDAALVNAVARAAARSFGP